MLIVTCSPTTMTQVKILSKHVDNLDMGEKITCLCSLLYMYMLGVGNLLNTCHSNVLQFRMDFFKTRLLTYFTSTQ